MENPLSKTERKAIRSRIFLHLDGLALIPTMNALNKASVFELFLERPKRRLSEITDLIGANEGYLNVALRMMSSQGYLLRKVDNETDHVYFELTDLGKRAFDLAGFYESFDSLIRASIIRPRNIVSENADIESLEKAWSDLKYFQDVYRGELEERMAIHMEGVLLGPAMVGLGITNHFKGASVDKNLSAKQWGLTQPVFKWIVAILESLLFVRQKDGAYYFTDKGLFYVQRASAYGVTVSYLPTFAQLDDLLVGNPCVLWDRGDEGHESHVYRYMNVWGSGGAHSTYFKKVDEIIVELFNKPIEEQPKGFIDVGCGDGTFIEHVFDLIYYKTKRGKMLKEHPLFVVGVDYNQKARVATRDTMTNADIWAEVEFGDISDPASLDAMLQEKFGVPLGDLLNTRTFLDHNRIYKKPEKVDQSCLSGGAFAYRGRRIPNNELFQNLVNHLEAWSPYLRKYGLLLVELHSINPKSASENIGKTLATPYDATHGFTDQYIIELPCFLNAAKAAGLKPIEPYLFRFPDEEKATVSIQLLKAV